MKEAVTQEDKMSTALVDRVQALRLVSSKERSLKGWGVMRSEIK
jgi:hypothetical protein